MQGKYAEARLAYEKLLDDETSVDLIKFRLYLTYLLEKNDEVARQHLEKIPLLNDSPIYFYGHAAWEFAHGDEKKAQGYLNSAETVFPKSKLSNFSDVFYDIGWLKRTTGTEPKCGGKCSVGSPLIPFNWSTDQWPLLPSPPLMLRILPLQLLLNLWVGLLPKVRQIRRHLNWPVIRREHLDHDGHASARDPQVTFDAV